MKLVHQQPLVTLGTGVLQRAVPEVSSNGGQLLGQRHNHEMHHQLIGQVCVGFGMNAQPFNLLAALVKSRKQVIIKVVPCFF